MGTFKYLSWTIVAALLLCNSASANSNACYPESQQVATAQRNAAAAENDVTRQTDSFYRSQAQLEDRIMVMQAQVDQLRYQARVIRSYPIAYFGQCWGWNVWGLAQCAAARRNRRSISIRNADVRVQQAQLRLENFIRYAQRFMERQAQRVAQAQELLATRTAQLEQANEALAQCRGEQTVQNQGGSRSQPSNPLQQWGWY